MLLASNASAMPRLARPRPPRRHRSAALAGAVFAGAVLMPSMAAASSMAIKAPAELVESNTAQVDVSATLDVASYVEVKLRAAGAPCAASAAADPGTNLLDRSAIEPTFAVTAVTSFDVAGQYVICGWARDTTKAEAPVVASASATINVRAPKLSLKVSTPASVAIDELFTVTTVASAEVTRRAYAGLVPNTGKGCPATYGELQKTKGVVPVLDQAGFAVTGGPSTDKQQISLPAKGKYLACGYFHRSAITEAPQATSKAEFTVGAPCVIPNLKGKTTAAAKKALAKAHCRLGKAKTAKSKTVKKGRIIRTGKKAGTSLPPDTAIGVIVSKGP